jgi:hypothetical protein
VQRADRLERRSQRSKPLTPQAALATTGARRTRTW